MTILSLAPYTFLPARTGGQKGIALFNEYLAKQVDLHCISTNKNDITKATYSVYPALSTSPLHYANPFYLFTIRKLAKATEAKGIIIEHPYYGWLGFLVKKLTGLKLIVHSHNIESHRFKTTGKWWWRILWHYEKWTHRQADLNFFIQNDDRQYAITNFALAPNKCLTVTYGIDRSEAPSTLEREAARNEILSRYNLDSNTCLLLFNGAFNYGPNIKALETIIEQINPLLLAQNFTYKIIICGPHLSETFSTSKPPNIIWAGFVDSIELYLKGTDIFLNPMSEGGGIKTKLVEALGFNLTAISTKNGAVGILPEWCNGQLRIVEDDDWKQFALEVVKARQNKGSIMATYFEQFYWEHIIARAVKAMKAL